MKTMRTFEVEVAHKYYGLKLLLTWVFDPKGTDEDKITARKQVERSAHARDCVVLWVEELKTA